MGCDYLIGAVAKHLDTHGGNIKGKDNWPHTRDDFSWAGIEVRIMLGHMGVKGYEDWGKHDFLT